MSTVYKLPKIPRVIIVTVHWFGAVEIWMSAAFVETPASLHCPFVKHLMTFLLLEDSILSLLPDVCVGTEELRRELFFQY